MRARRGVAPGVAGPGQRSLRDGGPRRRRAVARKALASDTGSPSASLAGIRRSYAEGLRAIHVRQLAVVVAIDAHGGELPPEPGERVQDAAEPTTPRPRSRTEL